MDNVGILPPATISLDLKPILDLTVVDNARFSIMRKSKSYEGSCFKDESSLPPPSISYGCGKRVLSLE